MRTFASSAVLASSLFGGALAATCPQCESFGVDFLDGGSYFQNVDSTDPFTALEEFNNCQNDTAQNILVAPAGNQFFCSNVPLEPNNTPQLVTCPIDKDMLTTGEWSLIVLSNNGDDPDCAPIDFQRDFFLTVGTQVTQTVTPTVLITSTSTPVLTEISTVTHIVTQLAKPIFTTVPQFTIAPTIIKQAPPVISVVTKAVFTITKAVHSVRVAATSTVTQNAQCSLPPRRMVPDPAARILATIIGQHTLGVPPVSPPTPTVHARSPSTEFKRAILEGRAVPDDVMEDYLEERRQRLGKQKRAPDPPTSTVTGTGIVTSTTTVTEPTTTITGVTTLVVTSTSTPTVTVTRGIENTVVTKTIPAQTFVQTFFVPVTTVFAQLTSAVTLSVTSSVTPSALAASCTSAGGIIS